MGTRGSRHFTGSYMALSSEKTTNKNDEYCFIIRLEERAPFHVVFWPLIVGSYNSTQKERCRYGLKSAVFSRP